MKKIILLLVGVLLVVAGSVNLAFDVYSLDYSDKIVIPVTFEEEITIVDEEIVEQIDGFSYIRAYTKIVIDDTKTDNYLEIAIKTDPNYYSTVEMIQDDYYEYNEEQKDEELKTRNLLHIDQDRYYYSNEFKVMKEFTELIVTDLQDGVVRDYQYYNDGIVTITMNSNLYEKLKSNHLLRYQEKTEL